MLLNTKVLVHFFLRSRAQEPQTCETFEERTNIQCCPFKKDHDSRDSTKDQNDSCKINKKLTRKNNHFDTPSQLFFPYLFSFPIITHMWVYFYRNKKRSEICKWENRYAKHFPIYFGSSWMERKLGRFGSRDLKCRVNFHILLLFLELDSLPLGTLGNGSFAPHYSLFSKKAKVAPTSLNWI